MFDRSLLEACSLVQRLDLVMFLQNCRRCPHFKIENPFTMEDLARSKIGLSKAVGSCPDQAKVRGGLSSARCPIQVLPCGSPNVCAPTSVNLFHNSYRCRAVCVNGNYISVPSPARTITVNQYNQVQAYNNIRDEQAWYVRTTRAYRDQQRKEKSEYIGPLVDPVDVVNVEVLNAVPSARKEVIAPKCNNDVEYEPEWYCRAQIFYKLPITTKFSEERLKALTPFICKGKYDIMDVKVVFKDVCNVLYELGWYSRKQQDDTLTMRKLEYFFRHRRQLSNFWSSKVTFKMRENDAFLYWLENYVLFQRIFCKRQNDEFAKKLSQYRDLHHNEVLHAALTKPIGVPHVVPSIKSSKTTRPRTTTKTIRREENTTAIGCKPKYYTQMFGLSSLRNMAVDAASNFASDVASKAVPDIASSVWEGILDSVKSIPERLVSFLSDCMTKGLEMINYVVTFVFDTLSLVCSKIKDLLIAIVGEEYLAAFGITLGVFAFVYLLWQSRHLYSRFCDVVSLAFVKVLRKMKFKVDAEQADEIRKIFADCKYTTQSWTSIVPILACATGIAIADTDTKTLSTANSVVNFASRLPNVCTSVEEAVKECIDWLYHARYGVHWLGEKKVYEEFESFLKEMDIIREISDLSSKVLLDLDLASRVMKLYKQSCDLEVVYRDCKFPQSFSMTLVKAFSSLKTLAESIRTSSDLYTTRVETALLWLHGKPGQGKTTTLEHLVAGIYERVRAVHAAKFSHPYVRNLVHYRDTESPFWEGYDWKSHFCVVYNEACQKTAQSERAKVLSEIIKACESGVYPLNMAFESKGKAFFASYLACVTSNLTEEGLTQSGLTDPTAVVRRRTLHLRVTKRETFTFEKANFDSAWVFQIEKSNNPATNEATLLGLPKCLHQKFRRLANGGSMDLTYSDVVTIMSQEIISRMAQRQETTNFMRDFDYVAYTSKPLSFGFDVPQAPSPDIVNSEEMIAYRATIKRLEKEVAESIVTTTCSTTTSSSTSVTGVRKPLPTPPSKYVTQMFSSLGKNRLVRSGASEVSAWRKGYFSSVEKEAADMAAFSDDTTVFYGSESDLNRVLPHHERSHEDKQFLLSMSGLDQSVYKYTLDFVEQFLYSPNPFMRKKFVVLCKLWKMYYTFPHTEQYCLGKLRKLADSEWSFKVLEFIRLPSKYSRSGGTLLQRVLAMRDGNDMYVEMSKTGEDKHPFISRMQRIFGNPLHGCSSQTSPKLIRSKLKCDYFCERDSVTWARNLRDDWLSIVSRSVGNFMAEYSTLVLSIVGSLLVGAVFAGSIYGSVKLHEKITSVPKDPIYPWQTPTGSCDEQPVQERYIPDPRQLPRPVSVSTDLTAVPVPVSNLRRMTATTVSTQSSVPRERNLFPNSGVRTHSSVPRERNLFPQAGVRVQHSPAPWDLPVTPICDPEVRRVAANVNSQSAIPRERNLFPHSSVRTHSSIPRERNLFPQSGMRTQQGSKDDDINDDDRAFASYKSLVSDYAIHVDTAYSAYPPKYWIDTYEEASTQSYVTQGDVSSIYSLSQHMTCIRVEYPDGRSFRAKGVLSGLEFITYAHGFDDFGPDWHAISIMNFNTVKAVFYREQVKTTPLSTRDLMKITFPRTFQPFFKLKRLYKNESDMVTSLALQGHFTRMAKDYAEDGSTILREVEGKRIVKGVDVISERVNIYGKDVPHNHRLYYIMVEGMGEAGDCGDVYISRAPDGSSRILGLHTGRSGFNSYYSPIFADDFTDAAAAYLPDFMHVNYVTQGPSVESHKYEFFAKAPRVKTIPNESRLIASPAQANHMREGLYPLTTQPACLAPTTFIDGENKWTVHPLKLAMKKLGASPARPMPLWLQHLVNKFPEVVFHGFFSPRLDRSVLRRWTMEEVLFGIPGVWQGLPRDTAVGYDIECCLPQVKSRKDLWDPERRYIHPILRMLVEKLDAAVRRGELPLNVVAACLKDETRDIERVKLGKTRLFYIGSLSHLIWTVMNIGALVTQMKMQRSDSDVAIGTNVHSFDWKMIMVKLGRFPGGKFGGGDYGNYDTSVNSWFGWMLGEACAPYYGYKKDSFEDLCLRFTCMSAVGPLLVCGSNVFHLSYLNSSGNWITGFLNSFVNVTILNVCMLVCKDRSDNEEFKNTPLSSSISKVVYGDDNLWCIPAKFAPYFDMKILKDLIFDLFGMDYTLPSKGAIEFPFLELDELSFLCRGFSFNGSNFRAPLEVDSIYSMVNWIRKPSNSLVHDPSELKTPMEQFLVNLETACQEWFHHGREVYERETEKIRLFCVKDGIPFHPREFNYYLDRWLSGHGVQVD